MKAYVLHGIGDLRLEEVPVPEPGDGEVLVRVRAMGICGSDIPRIFRTGAHIHPLIPGHEFSGIVEQTGKGVDESWMGERVGVFPLIPCGDCSPCRQRQYELCRHYNYLGSRTNGGFAEYVSVPERNLIGLPAWMPLETAAMLEPMAVAVHGIRRAGRKENASVAVCGLGTVGLLTAMFLKAEGCRSLFVIGNKDIQREKARQIGIDEVFFCDIRDQEPGSWLARRTGGEGVSLFFDCVGTPDVLNLAIRSCHVNGVIQAVGNPVSDMTLEKDVYWKILRNQLTIQGTWNSSFTGRADDDWHDVLGRLEGMEATPEILISHKLPFERLGEGVEMMREKSEEYVKVMGTASDG